MALKRNVEHEPLAVELIVEAAERFSANQLFALHLVCSGEFFETWRDFKLLFGDVHIFQSSFRKACLLQRVVLHDRSDVLGKAAEALTKARLTMPHNYGIDLTIIERVAFLNQAVC